MSPILKSRYFLASVILILLGLIVLVTIQSSIDNNDYYQIITSKLENEIDNNEQVLDMLSEKITSSSLVGIDISEFTSPNPYFIYKDKQLVLWSDNKFVPSF